MNRILFIVPPNISFKEFINPANTVKSIKIGDRYLRSIMTSMPIGIFSMSAYLKKNSDVKVKLLDLTVVMNKLQKFEYVNYKDFFADIISQKEFENFNPNIIAISALFAAAYSPMLDIAKVCKEIFPSSIIVVGGGVPTNMYKDIYKDSDAIDAVCYGEGEIPMLELVNAKNKYEYLDSNNSWITINKYGRQFTNNIIENLDEIPFYDYELCTAEDYNINPGFSTYSDKYQQKAFHVMTSRGCPFKCIFCSSHTVHGRKMRYFSIDRVEEDFKKLKQKYNVDTIIFQDDHLLADKKRALKILKIVKDIKFNTIFQNSLALFALDKEMIKAIKEAGANYLQLAIESGSERVLKEIMHKPLKLSIVKEVVKNCREIGINTSTNILIGLPGETKADIAESIKFLKTLDVSWFFIYCASPLIGSEMYKICIDNNYLKAKFNESSFTTAEISTNEFTSDYIKEMRYTMNLDLNFINNKDIQLGDYVSAVNRFESVIRAKEDHAFAYYYASICYKKLGNDQKSNEYLSKAKEFAKLDFWKKYITMFNLNMEQIV